MSYEADKKNRKVVCIEDEPQMVDLLILILKTNGFEAFGALSGLDGLELIKSVKPDLVLLDLMMPEMDGWQVYQRMKDDEHMRAIPVIIVTAKAQPIDETLARSIAKVDDYVIKPFSPNALVQKINKVLGDSDKAPQ